MMELLTDFWTLEAASGKALLDQWKLVTWDFFLNDFYEL